MARGQLLISRRVRQACVKLAQVTPRQKRVAAAASAHWSAICDGVQLYCKAGYQQPAAIRQHVQQHRCRPAGSVRRPPRQTRPQPRPERRRGPQGKSTQTLCIFCSLLLLRRTPRQTRRGVWRSSKHDGKGNAGFAPKNAMEQHGAWAGDGVCEQREAQKREEAKYCNVSSTLFEGASTFVHGRKGDLCAFYSDGALNKRNNGKGTPYNCLTVSLGCPLQERQGRSRHTGQARRVERAQRSLQHVGCSALLPQSPSRTQL
jgi:hypothetical protein